ncbi:MAG: cell division transport system permease protein [Actinomycetota bacterium]|nr:cell division transport system permease protein [Actinomycetota bacterium]
MGLRLKYFAGEAVVNLKRNLFMTIAAISTVAVSLFLLGGVIVLGHIVNNVVGTWEGKVELNVFLRDDISPTQQATLQDSIKGMPEVQDVIYDSKQQAFQEYKKMFEGSPALIQNVDPNALPASFRVKLHDPSKVDSVRSQLIGRAGIDSVTFGGDAVKKLLRINALLRTISLVMTILLLTAATVLIANTIRLAIYARRREIGVMKLVGATNWFIRVPFIFEGVVEAVAGAMVAAGVIWLAKMLWLDRLSSFLAFLPIGITAATVAKMFVVLVVVGISVGALGSTLALRRFLEV